MEKNNKDLEEIAGSTDYIPPHTHPQGSVPSESDNRTVNNVMRHEYRVLSDGEKEIMRKIKDKGAEFQLLIEEVEGEHAPSRELSIAKTKIEEAVMWAVKHITK